MAVLVLVVADLLLGSRLERLSLFFVLIRFAVLMTVVRRERVRETRTGAVAGGRRIR